MKAFAGAVFLGVGLLVILSLTRLSDQTENVQMKVPEAFPEQVIKRSDVSVPMSRAEAHRSGPTPVDDSLPAEAQTVPLLTDSEALAAFRQSIEHGDARAPAIVRSPEAPSPPDEVLEMPSAYEAWEVKQERALKQRFLAAAREKIAWLEKEVARARVMGLDAESLR
ncbi:MAG: hypothetical protein D6758_00925, partial [Gammaproteobacteria bacterium]